MWRDQSVSPYVLKHIRCRYHGKVRSSEAVSSKWQARKSSERLTPRERRKKREKERKGKKRSRLSEISYSFIHTYIVDRCLGLSLLRNSQIRPVNPQQIQKKKKKWLSPSSPHSLPARCSHRSDCAVNRRDEPQIGGEKGDQVQELRVEQGRLADP